MRVYLVISMDQDWRDIYGVYVNEQHAERIAESLNRDYLEMDSGIRAYVKMMDVIV